VGGKQTHRITRWPRVYGLAGASLRAIESDIIAALWAKWLEKQLRSLLFRVVI